VPSEITTNTHYSKKKKTERDQKRSIKPPSEKDTTVQGGLQKKERVMKTTQKRRVIKITRTERKESPKNSQKAPVKGNLTPPPSS